MTLDGLHGRYAAWFRARLVRRYGAHDAEDILQEAWLRLASYQGLAGIRHPKAFLLRVASNLALGQVRRSATAERFAGATPVVSHEDADQLETVFFRQMVLDLPQPLRYVETVIACYLALAAGREVRSSRACRSPEGGG
jgi:RNA polymerase sigma-70 factor (ECF subfamily)